MEVSLIKVLSIHWSLSLGGVGKYAVLINGASRHAPVRIQSLCILGRNWQCDQVTLERLDARKIVIKSRADISWVWRVPRVIDSVKPHLIMTHGFNGHFVVIVTRLLRKHNLPMICSYHGLYHAPSRRREVFKRLFNLMTEYFIRRRVLGVVSVTEYSKKYLVRKGVDPDKITVIHNGIDSSFVPFKKERHQLRKEWGVEDGEILLGAASRLDPVKGISYLVDAFAQVVRRMDNVRLVIVGTGTLDDSLKRHVHEMGLSSRIVFAGFRSDVDDCLSAFDVFVLPSVAEYHSIALLEAMRAQKAIIATNVGGNTESVRHEREALIVPPEDVHSLAKAIEKLATDEALRTRLAKTAHDRFQKRFTTEEMVRTTANWILRCGNLEPT